MTGCLHPTPTGHQQILPGIEPAGICCLEAALSLAKRGTLDPDYILHGRLAGSPDELQEILKSKRPFVPASRKPLSDRFELGIRVAQETNYRWSAEYSKSTSMLLVFIFRARARPLEINLYRISWVELNRLWTGVGRFHSSMYE